VFAKLCIWLSTRNWKRLALGVSVTYLFMLFGVLGADLIYSSKPAGAPALIGYVLLFASYAATAAIWSRLRVQPRERDNTNHSFELSCGGSGLEGLKAARWQSPAVSDPPQVRRPDEPSA
jgi:hypothetical protein